MAERVKPDVSIRYDASMVLSGVGDALGYKNGSWEFCRSGSSILKESEELGGIMKIEVEPKKWMVSDDTVMHLATGEALVSKEWNKKTDPKSVKTLYDLICKSYVKCWGDMTGRAPGMQCANAMPHLKKGHWDGVPFSPSGGGCGAAMRTMCIGLWFHKPEQQDDLIRISIESGRMTHNHPTGYYGGLVAALFTAYAIQDVPVHQWGNKLVSEVLPKAKKYIVEESKRDLDIYEKSNQFEYFENSWINYLKLRQLTGDSEPKFPDNYGLEERDAFYKSISYSGWGGSSGHDSVIIAYDALLGSRGSWEEFCHRGIIHGGDNDSTGAIGGAWFGALYGYNGVPENHYKKLEYLDRLKNIAKTIHKSVF